MTMMMYWCRDSEPSARQFGHTNGLDPFRDVNSRQFFQGTRGSLCLLLYTTSNLRVVWEKLYGNGDTGKPR